MIQKYLYPERTAKKDTFKYLFRNCQIKIRKNFSKENSLKQLFM